MIDLQTKEFMSLRLFGYDLPPTKDSMAYIHSLKKKTVYDLLKQAEGENKLLIQPRCGLGSHLAMKQLLQTLEMNSHPDILSLTIDSYTRLCHFDTAGNILKERPENLNGYPLVNHGWQRGRELNEAVGVPLEIRHGSPDARLLFEMAIASGITSFEGGGVTYNLPYCKNVPIAQSLEHWRYVDQRCGELAKQNIIVDRELFGTLTAVLMPPSICLAVTFLEALAAVREGALCISVAYCQGGHLFQDIAALRAIRIFFRRYLPKNVAVFPVLHEFMGAFPKERIHADAIIFLGGFVAKRGRAVKLVTKTYEEALGIPTAQANNSGIWTTRMGTACWFDFIDIPEERIEEEMAIILAETEEIVSSIIEEKNIYTTIAKAFEEGALDIPFSASRYAHSQVLPMRDLSGAIRYYHSGGLPFGEKTKQENQRLLRPIVGQHDLSLFKKIEQDIFYFCREELGQQGGLYENTYT